ncbi:nucleotidyltransferase family protein [Turneriella parva]|uniref:Nucleotidyltransferase n=1 Tax=Turneriella parva (strain ATCC BAA-1111 / DSM 21527 / NCTC 11395 / H) TaxID=869212 RepID=I4B2Z2_TURPD|nr:sugar phosphate nucleotidyltransferase [Turneriella parva]AFM11649.1 nucleotidyltransferase [Turneriella parva DSM 21527]
MNGFLLAAGLGTRLRPLTDKTAKPALPVAGLPMLAYSLNLFYQLNSETPQTIDNLVVNTHHAPQTVTDILDRLEQPWAKHISHEPQLLDTGGGVKKCESLLRNAPTLLANADIVCDVDVAKLLRFHAARGADLTIVVVPHPRANEIAPITIGEDDRVVDINRTFEIHNSGSHLYAGIAVFEPVLLDYLKSEPSSIVYTGYTGLIAAGKTVCAYVHKDNWFDCGTPETYAAAGRAVAVNAWHWQKWFAPEIEKLRS